MRCIIIDRVKFTPLSSMLFAYRLKTHSARSRFDIFHQILDCVSDTAAAEMRAAYKVGFKDGATMM